MDKYHSRAAELYRDEIKGLVSDQKKSSLSKFSSLSSQAADRHDGFDTPLESPAPTTTPSPTLSSSSSPSASSSPTVQTNGARSNSGNIVRNSKKGPVKKGLGAKKVSTSTFDDFDKPDDFEDTVKNTIAVSQDKTSLENVHSHSGAIRSSRLSYLDDDKPSDQDAKYTSTLGPSSISSSTKSESRSSSQFDSGDAQKRFGSAKSISSAQYFGENEKKISDGESERRLMKFNGSSSISSADFFDRDETPDLTAEGLARKLASTATGDLAQISTVVVESGRKITNLANDFFNDLQNRYQ